MTQRDFAFGKALTLRELLLFAAQSVTLAPILLLLSGSAALLAVLAPQFAQTWLGWDSRVVVLFLSSVLLVPFLTVFSWQNEFVHQTWRTLRLNGRFHQILFIKLFVALLIALLPAFLILSFWIPQGRFDGIENGYLLNGLFVLIFLQQISTAVVLVRPRGFGALFWALLLGGALVGALTLLSLGGFPLSEARTFFVLFVLTLAAHFGLQAWIKNHS